MRKKLNQIFLLLLCLLPLAASAQLQQYRDKRVADIQVVLTRPSDEFSERAIKSRMKTKVGDAFSQLEFDEDLKQLSKDFDRVEPKIDVTGNEVTITLTLTPKPVINRISFEGNEHYKSSKLQKELEVKPGDLFDRYTFNESFNKLKEFYVKKGYFESELNYRVAPVEGTNTVDIFVTVNEGRSGRVKKLRFTGFSKQEEKAVLELIYTKKFKFLTSWMTGAGTYQPEMSEHDRFIVLNYLHNQGYADAKVEVKAEELKRGLAIHFIAERGPLYKFGEITFSSNTIFSDEEIENVLIAKKGEPYSPEKLQATQEAIRDLYGSKGYIEAIASYEPKLVSGERVYDVNFNINEGEQYRVGLIRVFGNRRTQQRVILNECQLVPGQVFDLRKLKWTEQTLQNIGYFKCVNVYAVRGANEIDIGPRYRDVYIELEEDATGSVGLNLQASSDASFSLGLDLTERNFNYQGLSGIFRKGLGVLRGGGEYLRARAQFGFKERIYSLGWTKPYFMDTCWIIGFEVSRQISEVNSADYTLKKWAGSFTATYPINRWLRAGWLYRLSTDTTDINEKRLRRHKQFATLAELKKQKKEGDGVVSAVGFNLGYDSTNYQRTCGLQSLLAADLAGFFGEYRFLSLAYVNTYYHPLWRCATLKLRGNARFIQPLWGQNPDQLPLQERLYLGGEYSVRGFRVNHLGPKYADKEEPRGGLSTLFVSAEINHEFHPIISGFVFVDGGSNSRHRWRIRHLEWSVGFGFRLCLANNLPVQFGWGYPLNPDKQNRGNSIQHFFFSLDGRF